MVYSSLKWCIMTHGRSYGMTRTKGTLALFTNKLSQLDETTTTERIVRVSRLVLGHAATDTRAIFEWLLQKPPPQNLPVRCLR